MGYEVYTCSDVGTKFCPCHLAESGQCIICSQLNSGNCHCTHWSGVCVYQELIWNNNKAKSGRENYKCKVVKKNIIEEDIILLTLEGGYELLHDLKVMGSFVFLKRLDKEESFFTPISLMDIDLENSTMTLAIELKGIKTIDLSKLEVDDIVVVKGPFWNGILGLRHLKNLVNNVCLLVCRGIGQAPMIPVLKHLHENGNKVIVLNDKANIKGKLIDGYLEKYAYKVYSCNCLEKGKLTKSFKELFIDQVISLYPAVIHCDGADILNYEVMELLEKIKESLKSAGVEKPLKYSCCNNTKMCCGEGVCGACTRKNNDRKLRRLCKMQTDPKYVLEGRRLF
ncbi:MAG: sulfide/dihydroorotate dehydrogenase-like FAD/NAD-binding protein [Clostridium sp.]